MTTETPARPLLWRGFSLKHGENGAKSARVFPHDRAREGCGVEWGKRRESRKDEIDTGYTSAPFRGSLRRLWCPAHRSRRSAVFVFLDVVH